MTVLRQLLLEGVLFLGHIVWVVTDVSRDISGFLVVANIVHYFWIVPQAYSFDDFNHIMKCNRTKDY